MNTATLYAATLLAAAAMAVLLWRQFPQTSTKRKAKSVYKGRLIDVLPTVGVIMWGFGYIFSVIAPRNLAVSQPLVVSGGLLVLGASISSLASISDTQPDRKLFAILNGFWLLVVLAAMLRFFYILDQGFHFSG